MNSFVNAVQNTKQLGKTFNGATTLKTTGDYIVDLFGAAGNRDANLDKAFDLAHGQDSKLAFRVALWTRDIRGGAGERKTFRNLLMHFEKHYKEELLKLLPKIPELGRWDDLLVFTDKRIKQAAFMLIRDGLSSKNGLTAKWMPRKGHVADELRRFLDLNWSSYRKLLVHLSKTVETQMCAKNWDQIVYDHVPSVASARYQKAFGRHSPERYSEYLKGLVKVKPDGTPERKINAGAVFPYDVLKSIDHGERAAAVAQWEALPDWLGDDKILPLIDSSGSMTAWSYYGQRNSPNTTVTPLQIAASLGLYVATKQKGAFAGMFMTFESRPTLMKLTGDLVSMYRQVASAPWGGSTNIEGAFTEILNVAKANQVPEADMPRVLLILSDMEFDSCIADSGRYGRPTTNYDNLDAMYTAAGYKLPKVIFWAINGRADNNPVSFKDNGTALVSGFSPSIFKTLLRANLEQYTPRSVMLETLNDKRYDVEGVTV